MSTGIDLRNLDLPEVGWADISIDCPCLSVVCCVLHVCVTLVSCTMSGNTIALSESSSLSRCILEAATRGSESSKTMPNNWVICHVSVKEGTYLQHVMGKLGNTRCEKSQKAKDETSRWTRKLFVSGTVEPLCMYKTHQAMAADVVVGRRWFRRAGLDTHPHQDETQMELSHCDA